MAWLEKRKNLWHIACRDERGKVRRVKAYTDKASSRDKLAEFVRAQARGERGLVDPFAEHKKRDLPGHVEDYVKELRTLGRDEKYIYNIDKRLRKLVKDCG